MSSLLDSSVWIWTLRSHSLNEAGSTSSCLIASARWQQRRRIHGHPDGALGRVGRDLRHRRLRRQTAVRTELGATHAVNYRSQDCEPARQRRRGPSAMRCNHSSGPTLLRGRSRRCSILRCQWTRPKKRVSVSKRRPHRQDHPDPRAGVSLVEGGTGSTRYAPSVVDIHRGPWPVAMLVLS